MYSDSAITDDCLDFIWTKTGCHKSGEVYPMKNDRKPKWRPTSLM